MIFMGWSAARIQATVADGSCDLCTRCEDCKGDPELLGRDGAHGTHARVDMTVRAAAFFFTAKLNCEGGWCD